MKQGARTAITLTVLAVVLIAAVVWGFSAMTQPFPGRIQTPACVDTEVAVDERVRTDQVVVSVLNASTRQGLASRTMGLLTDAGFRPGETGNAPQGSGVAKAQVWVTALENPAIRLVKSWLGGETPVRVLDELPAPGLVVVVGNQFQKLKKGQKEVRTHAEGSVCMPPPAPTP